MIAARSKFLPLYTTMTMSVALGLLVGLNSLAEEPKTKPEDVPTETAPESTSESPEAAGRDEVFGKMVANVRLSGHFTLDGRENAKLEKETYVITGATKLGNGDLWAINARIKFGEVDVTLPVPVQVKWAGNTPVITLEKVSISGLGTFSARVLLDEGRYAGTWAHDDKGGHLFGTIKPAGEEP